jgi:hypothetical protein
MINLNPKNDVRIKNNNFNTSELPQFHRVTFIYFLIAI